jgi:hypothetical protein
MQMLGDTVANATPMPLTAIQRGEIYIVMGTCLCQVLKIGHTDYPDIPSFTHHRPDCITIKCVGYRILAGRWWEVDWAKAKSKPQYGIDTHQYDRRYFFPWDRCGVLYGSIKARRLKGMIADVFKIGLKLRGHENRHDARSIAIYQKARQAREQWDRDVEALFNSLADPKRYPKLPPPPRPPPAVKTKVAPAAWQSL